ncbi:MAG TPA: tetratricopeptide repeat protein [bacterium]|nr:tetratricopeptide repeat protein [bacterium]
MGRHGGARFDRGAAATGTTPENCREALDRRPQAGTSAPKTTFGQRLREARRALGLTQDELGRPDFTKGFISQLEHDRAKPSVASLELLAARLARPASYFLDGSETVISSKFLDVLRSRGRAELTSRRFDAALETFAEMRRVAAGRRDVLAELYAAVGEGEALLGLERAEDARARLEAASGRAGATGASALECRASHRLAAIELQQGRYGRAVALSRTALNLADRSDGAEPSLRGEIQLQLGTALTRMGRLDEAADAYRAARRIFEEATQPNRVGEALYGLGAVLAQDGDYDAAMLHFERAQGLFEQYADMRHLSEVRDQAGVLLMQTGRPAEALEQFAAGLAVSRRVGDVAGECRTLTEYARCLYACGEAERAKEFAERAASRSHAAGLPDEAARAQALLGALAAASGELKEAQRALAAAAKHCEVAGLTVDLVAIYKDLARVAGLSGRYKEATGYHERAFKLLQAVRPADMVAAVRSDVTPPAGASIEKRTSR